jgi:nicotinate-nucleotide pyrophosphorylase (carboxylating)
MLSSSKRKRAAAVRKSHCHLKAVSLADPAYKKAVNDFFTASVTGDLFPNGDISSALLGNRANEKVTARIISKCTGVAAGLEEVKFFFSRKHRFLKGGIEFIQSAGDGQKIRRGTVLGVLKGRVGDILSIERTVLNFLQRMGGIATMTNDLVKAVSHYTLVTSTRKTILGLTDKKAVVVGGGGTHRINLSDAVLIKDNHISIVKGDLRALMGQMAKIPSACRFVEIEVTSAKQAKLVVDIFSEAEKSYPLHVPFFLMFDNCRPADIKPVIDSLRRRPDCRNIYFEASGGINGKNIRSYAKSGVDVISSGTLTHSAPALDISLEIDA